MWKWIGYTSYDFYAYLLSHGSLAQDYYSNVTFIGSLPNYGEPKFNKTDANWLASCGIIMPELDNLSN